MQYQWLYSNKRSLGQSYDQFYSGHFSLSVHRSSNHLFEWYGVSSVDGNGKLRRRHDLSMVFQFNVFHHGRYLYQRRYSVNLYAA